MRRRKTLIRSLIEEQRAKIKSNAALKAGLDSLRTFKAAAEANEQRLIAELDKTKTELGEAQETISRHANEHLEVQSDDPSANIDERLDAQAELIQSLEQELKESKGKLRDLEKKDSELDQLREELETRNKVWARSVRFSVTAFTCSGFVLSRTVSGNPFSTRKVLI